MAKLVVRNGRNVGSEFKLNADRLVMGRRSACPIPILDPKASREHAAILRKGDQFFVLDLSRNGTHLNNRPASTDEQAPSPLKFGDKISIGETVLEMVDEKTEPIEIEIPGYRILEKIGQGGMGVVYKAKQLSMDRVVALKVLGKKYSQNREFVDRFIREARAAGRLNHPNVIHVHDVSKAAGLHYFSMEYIDGNSVKELLRIHRKLEPEKVLDIGIQTAKALEFAHETGIIHRDIKPDNIMLTSDGVVKIADLGIAKMWEEQASATGDTRKVMGTPHYMAPEQALGKDIDYRVDIYALGASMYHMLTGTTPFSGATAHEVLRAHIKDSLPPIQEFSPGAPDPLCFIVERMMAKLPEKRYANMTRLIEDLERAQKGLGEAIERIPAGDSTILRAMGAKEAAQVQKRNQTEQLGTGVQTPVGKVALYALLAAASLLLIVGVALLVRRLSQKDPDPAIPGQQAQQPPRPADPPQVPVAPVPDPGQVNAEFVKKQIEQAKALLEGDPVSARAEGLLYEVVRRFPTLGGEARTILDGIEQARKKVVRDKAKAIFDGAQEFEIAHRSQPEKSGEIAQKWQAVLGDLQGAPDLLQLAKSRAESWQQQHQETRQRLIDEAWRGAAGQVDSRCQAEDYDAARLALQGFLQQFGGAPQKKDAETRLAEVNSKAESAFQAVQKEAQAKREEKSGSRPIPAAIEIYKLYLARVRDGVNGPRAEAAIKDLEKAAQAEFERCEKVAVQQVRLFDFKGALEALSEASSRLQGTEFEAKAKARESEVLSHQELHARVVKILNDRAREKAIEFKPELTFAEYKEGTRWRITEVKPDSVTFEPAAKKAGFSLPKRYHLLESRIVYDLYRLALASPTQDDHKALELFCRARGLEAEGTEHAREASKKAE